MGRAHPTRSIIIKKNIMNQTPSVEDLQNQLAVAMAQLDIIKAQIEVVNAQTKVNLSRLDKQLTQGNLLVTTLTAEIVKAQTPAPQV